MINGIHQNPPLIYLATSQGREALKCILPMRKKFRQMGNSKKPYTQLDIVEHDLQAKKDIVSPVTEHSNSTNDSLMVHAMQKNTCVC